MTARPGMPPRSELQALLRRAHPWLGDDLIGPANVVAGTCDRCDAEPRLVEVCGPGRATALGRRCVAAVGRDGWCDGHADLAATALERLARLPDEADDVAWLWWWVTGEVRLPPDPVGRAKPAALSGQPPGRSGDSLR